MPKFPQATLVWRLGCWCVALFPLPHPHPHRLLSCRFQPQFDFPGYTAHSWSTCGETGRSHYACSWTIIQPLSLFYLSWWVVKVVHVNPWYLCQLWLTWMKLLDSLLHGCEHFKAQIIKYRWWTIINDTPFANLNQDGTFKMLYLFTVALKKDIHPGGLYARWNKPDTKG